MTGAPTASGLHKQTISHSFLHMLRFVVFCLIAIGVAFAPLGSIAHAKAHASHETALNAHQHDAGHKAQHDGHDHSHASSKPCDTKSQKGGTDCCALGCQLILAETASYIVGASQQKPELVVAKIERHSGTGPFGFDRPPRT